ncbi:MAG: hypothetical protein ABIP61_12555 [Burkholderiaceae bacterium]
MMKKTLVAALFAVAAVGAQAALTSGVAANQNPASFIDLSVSGVVAGGALYTANAVPDAAIPMNTTPPKNTIGTWLASGPTNANNGGGNAVVDFGAGTSFVSFLWGSPDTYNSLTVTLADNSTQSFGSVDFPSIVFNGNQSFASYIGFSTTGGDMIKSLTFS